MADPLESLVVRLIELSAHTEGGARRLPPERQLVEKLEISRGALREQLAMLEYLGVLRRRQGHGTYLDVPDASLFRTSFTLMHRLGYLSTAQFVQAREMVEEAIAAQAALEITDDDLIELRAIVDKMVARTAAGDQEGALNADLEFHNYLYETVDNPVFNMMNEGLGTVLRESIRARRCLAVDIEHTDADGAINTDTVHFGIVDALATRDPELARAAMHKHFIDFSALSLQARTETGTQS
ncbi:FadR/GntR family transcriptional regulator [Nocardia callitridis]|uniref:FadR/GntR family transcriptional regulator n=1 Tax=Nocardia callitridis TaxID=648753 RepID=A0ABP9KQ44_9NOCA